MASLLLKPTVGEGSFCLGAWVRLWIRLVFPALSSPSASTVWGEAMAEVGEEEEGWKRRERKGRRERFDLAGREEEGRGGETRAPFRSHPMEGRGGVAGRLQAFTCGAVSSESFTLPVEVVL